MRVHFLTQFAWPDNAPTGVYVEQAADALREMGHETVIVAGTGRYRKCERPAPHTPMQRLSHYEGNRSTLASVAMEYHAVARSFREYIRANVASGDQVIVTSAPPLTIHLYRDIHRAGGRAVYWLQDYYPELLRGLWNYPNIVRKLLRAWWNARLSRWDGVIKAAANLGYRGSNTVLFRNWPTLALGDEQPFLPGTAVYSGNLGFGHDLDAFLSKAEELQTAGYRIIVRGDGAKIAKLPKWISVEPMKDKLESLIHAYWEAEIHLIAGSPRLREAVFPSKYWNAKATGRRVIASGMEGVMLEEFQACQAQEELWPDWSKLVA